MPNTIESFLEVYTNMVHWLIMLQILSEITLRLKICSLVLLPLRKPACSSDKNSSVKCYSLRRIIFNIILLECEIRLIFL